MSKTLNHMCGGKYPHKSEGPSIAYCYEDDEKKLWVVNFVFCASQVNFCPYCGYEAPTKIEKKKEKQTF